MKMSAKGLVSPHKVGLPRDWKKVPNAEHGLLGAPKGSLSPKDSVCLSQGVESYSLSTGSHESYSLSIGSHPTGGLCLSSDKGEPWTLEYSIYGLNSIDASLHEFCHVFSDVREARGKVTA